MSFSSIVKHWFTEAPHFEGTIIVSERIGARIQKVTIALPAPVTNLFPIGCYVQTIAWGCIPRAYSVATADTRSFAILVSFSGGGASARFFRDAVVGDKVTCYGPFDDFPYRYGTSRRKVFFATSTGVAPFRRMIEEAIKEKVDSVLLLGSPKESDVAFKSEFEELSRNNPSFTFVPCLSYADTSWTGARGYVTDQVNGKEEFLKKSDVYICGIPAMTFGVLGALRAIGVSKNQIFVQKFG
jgi:CDP-4-dehydro-6-deoxyglucose reductase